uniref:Receptor protein-tyrosine kinase n=1 Tax=Elaeophora elaphi TaxID=1147741 RepID=A0A0R3RUM5_9BILA
MYLIHFLSFSVCPGTDNSRTELLDKNRINYMIKQYQDCTNVYGNLEITYIRREHLNGTDPDRFFSFLKDIKQITGYLLIYGNEIDQITLPNLQIIWGDTRHDDIAAIDISYNENLKYVNLPMLRSVQRGDVVLMYNPYLCNWNSTVSYREIMGKGSESRVQFMNNFEKCDQIQSECAENCGKYCWGPDTKMCQIVYREICPQDCPSQMCYQKDNKTHCCDEECAAGCYGEGKGACIACAKFEQDSKCVDKCNGLTDYDRTLKMTVNHSNPRYTYDRYCVEQCPKLMRSNLRKKRYRSDGGAFSACYMNEPIDSSNIGSLENCTVIEGFVQLLRHPFQAHRKFFIDGRPPMNISALKLDMLSVLRNVKVITEFLDVQTAEFSPTSLDFLGNLTTIEGRQLNLDRFALFIFKNQNLEELGLRSLKKIKNGRVFIGENENLCYMDTLNGYWNEILDVDSNNISDWVKVTKNGANCGKLLLLFIIVMVITAFVAIILLHTPSLFQEKYTVMITAIAFLDAGVRDQACAPDATVSTFYMKDNQCRKCHPQCMTCNGPTARDCIICMNVRIQQGDQWECIAECPTNHYFDGDACLPCARACYDFGCTGPREIVGRGGCNKCRYAKRSSNGQTPICLYATGKPRDVCHDNNLAHYYATTTSNETFIAEFECDECRAECLTCVGYGTSVNRHKCKCTHYITRKKSGDNHCTMECEKDSFLVRLKSTDGIGECEQCDELCDLSMGCKGPSSTNCSKCARAGVLLGDKLVCMEYCPKDHSFVGDDKICYKTDPEALASKKRLYMIIIGVLGAAILIAIIAGITMNCMKYKKRYQKELEMNLPSIPEYEQTDPSMRPNMTRLCIITSEHLEKTQQSLGQGAFGTVFLKRLCSPVYPLCVSWLQNPESRPSFVILKEKFNQYCKAPHLYVLDRYYKRQLELLGNQNEQMFNGEMNSSELSDQFKLSGDMTVTSSVSPSPTTPSWISLQQSALNVQQDGRMGSTDSGRYQSDPVHDGRAELSMDEGNYLIPNNKQSIFYTPVVVRENGETELIKNSEYYNDKVGVDYYNQVKSVSANLEDKTTSIQITTYQNDYYFAENEASL